MHRLTQAQERIDRELSDSAKAVGFSFFAAPGSVATFHLQKSEPSPECQAALDELVEKGFATVEPYNRFGGVVYRGTVSFGHLTAWMWNRTQKGISLVLWQPISATRRALQDKEG